jgi:ribosome biogenesis GTPase / thiamine phosphate phosphatase
MAFALRGDPGDTNMELSSLGWSDFFERQLQPSYAPRVPARVAFRHGHQLAILTAAGERSALLASRLLAEDQGAVTVGDWVLADLADDPATVGRVLARRTTLRRKAAGRSSDEQVLAANVDLVLVVESLDREASPRRLERLAAQAWESGAEPVVVLSKGDLCSDLPSRIREAAAAVPGAPVIATAALAGAGAEELRALLDGRRTAVMVGPSGAGKSTIANLLLGGERQRTGAVRDLDQRGRHVTTSRRLLPLPGGGALIDGPGLREVGLWGGDEGLEAAFAEVAELAAGCRFVDCRHDGEPGCAVAAAVEAGRLDPARVASFAALQRELAWNRTRHDAAASAERERFWRTIHRAQRQFERLRRRERG